MKKELTHPKLLEKAQRVFNSYIRARDAGLPCICCGSMNTAHAGHYLSQGHHSALRFNEENVNLCCVKCNTYLGGNLINYRRGLVKKIGAERVEFLEGSAERRKAHKWSRTELLALIEYYQQKIK